jgi:ParB family transcriptional regulator, chromosome partitioning protein
VAKQKFGLSRGRGLDALLSGASDVLSAQQPAQIDPETLPVIAVENIVPNPRQPRRIIREEDAKLLELSASIKEHGLLQPIIVTRLDSPRESSDTPNASDVWLSDDMQAGTQTTVAPQKYQIIAGERRWRASRLAGLEKVPVVIKDVTPQQMLELALIENIQRADLNPIEEAMAYQALIQEFGLTQELVAQQVGKDRSTITNSLRLLQLSLKVRDALINQSENFTEGHARAIGGIAHEEGQVQAMNQIIALHLNVRQAEELAKRIKTAENVSAAVEKIATTPPRSPDVADLETHFRDALMVKVDLKLNAKGKGTLVLHFNNQDELENLYGRLVKKEEQ